MTGIIYKITNIENGHIYIGQTIMTLNQRWLKHVSRSKADGATGLAGAIAKYGKDNFTMEVIEYADKELLDDREIYWIQYYNSFHGDGYNLTLGGEGSSTIELPLEEIKALYLSGETCQSLGQKYNCSDKTIKNRLVGIGVEVRRSGQHTEKQRVQALKNLEKGRVPGGRPENFKKHVDSLKKKISKLTPDLEFMEGFDSLSAACASVGVPSNHTNRLSSAAKDGRMFKGFYWELG